MAFEKEQMAREKAAWAKQDQAEAQANAAAQQEARDQARANQYRGILLPNHPWYRAKK